MHAVRGVIHVFGVCIQRGAERAYHERESSSGRNNGAPPTVFVKGRYIYMCVEPWSHSPAHGGVENGGVVVSGFAENMHFLVVAGSSKGLTKEA